MQFFCHVKSLAKCILANLAMQITLKTFAN